MYEHCYNVDPIFSTPCVKHIMPYRIFYLIDLLIHSVDSSSLEEHYEKTPIIKPLLANCHGTSTYQIKAADLVGNRLRFLK